MCARASDESRGLSRLNFAEVRGPAQNSSSSLFFSSSSPFCGYARGVVVRGRETWRGSRGEYKARVGDAVFGLDKVGIWVGLCRMIFNLVSW